MTNLIAGIFVAISVIIGIYFAWKFQSRQQYFFAITLLVLCGLILRVFVATDCYLHPWDERYHALVAKNLMTNPFIPALYKDPLLPYDYTSWISNHIWLHKQPFPLWSMALSMKIFGVNEFALRIPSVLLSTISILLLFYIGSFLYNKKVGFYSALLLTLYGFLIEITGGRDATDHIDTFFFSLILLSISFAVRFIETQKHRYIVFLGIGIGCAVLSKWLAALIVFPIFFFLLLDSRRYTINQILFFLLFTGFIATCIAAPWQIYIFHTFPKEAQWESTMNFRHFTEVVERHTGPFFYHFDHLQIKYGPFMYIPVIWFVWKTIKQWKNYRREAIVMWFLVPYVLFTVAKTKLQGYTLFVAPALFLITGLFIHYLLIYRHRFKYKWLPHAFLFGFFFFFLWQTVERTKLLTTYDRNPVWSEEIKNLKVKGDAKQLVIFNAPHPIETMFYYDCIAYNTIQDQLVINKIKSKGYSVLILP